MLTAETLRTQSKRGENQENLLGVAPRSLGDLCGSAVNTEPAI